MDNENTTNAEAGSLSKDLILELNFVPDWARKPPETNFFDRGGSSSYSDRPERERDSFSRRSDFRERRPDQRGARKPDSRDRRRDERAAGRGDERQQGRGHAPREQREWVEKPPVNVRFLPQHKYLSEVIRRIRLSRRAHPLMQVAGLFISNPGSCEVRVDVDQGVKDVFIYQCKVCGMIAMQEDAIYRHMMQKHLDDFFVKEEKEGQAPEGKFTCVLQCGLSGALIGPPNHHSTAERIREIRVTQYPHMTETEFKGHLKTVHEPEKIEQWKEQTRKTVAYRLKTAAEGEPALDWAAAEAHFRSKIAAENIVKMRRVTLSGMIAREIQDRGLALCIRDAWQHESRFPSSLVGALRGAFHNKDLQLFKAGKGAVFVSDIAPSPLDPETAIPVIREVLLYLKDHPGCTRKTLVEALRPGSALDSEAAREIVSPLAWLIERGHMIEFSDGNLAIIGGGKPHPQQQARGADAGDHSAPAAAPLQEQVAEVPVPAVEVQHEGE